MNVIDAFAYAFLNDFLEWVKANKKVVLAQEGYRTLDTWDLCELYNSEIQELIAMYLEHVKTTDSLPED